MMQRGRIEVSTRYTRTAVVLHWLVAAILLAQIPFGWYVDEIPRGTPARAWYINLHKSIGLTLGLVILFRLFWRWSHPPPPLLNCMPSWQRIGARASHIALYACMLLMPLTGYIASNFSRWGVKYFNAILLPPWGVDDKQIYAFFNGAHVAISYVFVALILVHVLAALRHAAAHDGVFQRMWRF
ncbi:MAG TPA: cytochrome b [Steroidobacter sp.]|jgi:cytochrome b561|nr:cytochrome b [Steroidobacter sp.]